MGTAKAFDYGAPPPAVYKEEKLPPQPFAYEYGVNDDYSKANFKKTETQDANGVVAGSYVIALPDGRIQTTKYTADPQRLRRRGQLRGHPSLPSRVCRGIRPCRPRCCIRPCSPRVQALCLSQ